MSNDVRFYVSKLTGERVETHAEAMALWREGHDIECWGWSNALQDVICRLVWEH